MKKINRSKLVLNKDVVRVLGNRDLADVAGAMINIKSQLDECISVNYWTCAFSCARNQECI